MNADHLVDQACVLVRADPVTPPGIARPDALADRLDRHLDRLAPLAPAEVRAALRARALARLVGLGALERWLGDPAVTEVAVNAGHEIWVERGGPMEQVGTLATGEIETVIERVTSPLGLRFDRTNPIVDARLPDGARLCAVMSPPAVDGTCVSVRRFALRAVTLDAFAPPEVAALVGTLIHRRCNVVVTGATSSGKTTLLNAMAGLVPAGERIVTIEDTAELAGC